MSAPIPLVDLGALHDSIRSELDEAVASCISRNSFIGGPDHAAFAEEFAEFCGDGAHAALVGSGTAALELALTTLLGPGDGTAEIVTVSHTFFATAEAIIRSGYRPVFVDVDPGSLLLDPSLLEAAIGPRTRAILPVHLYGQMVDLQEVRAIANRHDLKVIEDAAQAHGATWRGEGPGYWSDAACFSFYPGKNLGAWGDAGAVVSRDQGLVQEVRQFANHGRAEKYLHRSVGTNSRLDGIQAAVLRVKLRHLPRWNEQRRIAAGWYDELLADEPAVERVVVAAPAVPVFHLYAVQVEQRDLVLERMRGDQIGAGVHYPIPIHEQPALCEPSVELPVTSRAARRVLSLPIYPELRREQAERVVASLLRALRTAGGD